MSTPSIVYLRRLGNARALVDALEQVPDLADLPFAEQQAALTATLGPFSAPIVAELRLLGWDASELILGVPSIREAWVREHGPLPQVPGVEDPDVRLAVGEVLRRRPDVVLDVNVTALDRATVPFLRRSVPELRILAGRMGTSKRYHRALHLDLSLVPCDVIADAIRPLLPGAVHVLPHSFDAAVADRLGPREVEHPLVFTGALGPRYELRHAVLIALLEATPVEAWIGLRKGVVRGDDGRLTSGGADGPTRADVVARLPARLLAAAARRSDRFVAPFNAAVTRRSGGRTRYPTSLEDPQHRFPDRCHPPVAGREYLALTRRAGTVVHREGDDLDGCGGALRLFEVTGAGAALLVDDSPMVRRLFEPDKEVVVYRNPDEAVAKARWLTDHPGERERIAAAGQARTLRDHSTETRAALLDRILRQRLGRPSAGAPLT